MQKTPKISKFSIKRKLITAVFITLSVGAFATLGDGKSAKITPVRKNLLTHPTTSYTGFSLKSGYNYRGNNILNGSTEYRVVNLNTVVTYQKGNTTYIMPVKKQVLLNKVKFNPAPQRF